MTVWPSLDCRVAIARTIAPTPSVLLFDEPLSNLDAKLRVEMRTELMRPHRATGATTVHVTHDQIEAMTMAGHVAVLNRGRVQQFGAPGDLIDHPEIDFVATFVGNPPDNMVPVVKNGTGYKVGGRHLPLTPPADDCLAMCRPEAMTLSDSEGETTLPMELVEAGVIAGRVMVAGQRDGQRLSAIVDRASEAQIGATIQFCLPPRPDSWSGPDGERIG